MKIWKRWREWRGRRAENLAVQEEMRFHIEQETQHHMRRGLSERDARRTANRSFGGIDRYAEEARDERPGTRLAEFAMSWLDWKLGARMLMRYPGLTIVSGITLAAAIGLGAGWFEMTLLTLNPDIQLDDGDRIVRIETWDASTSAVETRSMHDFVSWRDELTSIEQLTASRTVMRNLIRDDGAAFPVQVAVVTPSAFPLARVRPLIGRGLIEEDAAPAASPVVVLGYDLWVKKFGAERGVVGSTVRIGPSETMIVGVMPEGFAFPRNHEMWLPLRVTDVAALEGPSVQIIGRLTANTAIEAAQAELAAVAARKAVAEPGTHTHLRPRIYSLAEPSGSGAASELMLINVAAWILLVAASANVATLMFARTAMRESEIVVRNALGASRVRIMGQLFTEALVLTGTAAAVGLTGVALTTQWVFDAMERRDERLPFWYEAGIEPVTFLYTAVLAVAGAGLISLLPAIRATGNQVSAGLSRAATGGTSMRFGGVWSVIIVLQVAFSVGCLPFAVAAALDVRRNDDLRAAFPADTYVTFRPELGLDVANGALAADDTERMADVLQRLSRRLENHPGVSAVSMTATLPGTWHPLRQVEAQRGAGSPAIVTANTDGRRVRMAVVGTGYFDVFDQAVVIGRAFHARDMTAQNRVIINEALARNIGGNPVGVRLRTAPTGGNEAGPWKEVVGVVRNLGLTPTGRGEADFMYEPLPAGTAGHMVARVAGDQASLLASLRSVAAQVDPDLRVHDLITLREVIRREDLPALHSTLAGIGVVVLAIILSAASLYALMSVAVARRTREIGIRVAIGATPRRVLTSLFARAATQIGIGIILGNVLVVVMLSAMTETLEITRIMPVMLLASVVMLFTGFAACLVPGRRALRVQPTRALKEAN